MRPYADSLIEIARANGYAVVVTSARRSTSKQRQLYRRWQQGLSPYPVARPGTSTHELGIAFDLDVRPRDGLARLGRLWESWGGRWGGRFNDPIHFDAKA